MKTLFLILLLSITVFPCGVPGVVSGQIRPGNLWSVFKATRITMTMQNPEVVPATAIHKVNPFGYYSFEVDPCMVYTFTPNSGNALDQFTPASYVITTGLGDYPNINFMLN